MSLLCHTVTCLYCVSTLEWRGMSLSRMSHVRHTREWHASTLSAVSHVCLTCLPHVSTLSLLSLYSLSTLSPMSHVSTTCHVYIYLTWCSVTSRVTSLCRAIRGMAERHRCLPYVTHGTQWHVHLSAGIWHSVTVTYVPCVTHGRQWHVYHGRYDGRQRRARGRLVDSHMSVDTGMSRLLLTSSWHRAANSQGNTWHVAKIYVGTYRYIPQLRYRWCSVRWCSVTWCSVRWCSVTCSVRWCSVTCI